MLFKIIYKSIFVVSTFCLQCSSIKAETKYECKFPYAIFYLLSSWQTRITRGNNLELPCFRRFPGAPRKLPWIKTDIGSLPELCGTKHGYKGEVFNAVVFVVGALDLEFLP
jgi:hypothetical protein